MLLNAHVFRRQNYSLVVRHAQRDTAMLRVREGFVGLMSGRAAKAASMVSSAICRYVVHCRPARMQCTHELHEGRGAVWRSGACMGVRLFLFICISISVILSFRHSVPSPFDS